MPDQLPSRGAVAATFAALIRFDSSGHSAFGVTIGEVYPVQAMRLWKDGGWWVYLDTDPYRGYPYPFPLEFFSVVDASLPAAWNVKFEEGEMGLRFKRLAFAEWAEDDVFYERLVDGDPATVEVYAANRRI